MPHPDHGEHAAAVRRQGCAAASRAACGGSAPTTSTCSTCTSPTAPLRCRRPWRTVAELVAEGKIGALGVSNFAAWQIAEINHAADDVGAPRPIVAQQLYNLVARRVEEEYLEFAAAHRTAHHGLQPARRRPADRQAQLRGQARPRAGSATPSSPPCTRQRYWDTQLFEAVNALAEIADEAGITLAELSLRWLLYRDGVGSCCSAAPRWSSCRPTSPPWPGARCPTTSPPPATPSAPGSAARCPPTTADAPWLPLTHH